MSSGEVLVLFLSFGIAGISVLFLGSVVGEYVMQLTGERVLALVGMSGSITLIGFIGLESFSFIPTSIIRLVYPLGNGVGAVFMASFGIGILCTSFWSIAFIVGIRSEEDSLVPASS